MKIRDLKRILLRLGYRMRPGKGSHCVWSHPTSPTRPIVLHGSDHDDAHPYQIARVRKVQDAQHSVDR
jgi:predicted RNA binding protein YcfA (HicA-like mRNA interferase family)